MTASTGKKRVGVLALQGDFEAHRRALTRAGAEAVEVRSAADLQSIQGLVIPGGESTTMMKLLEEEKLLDPLRAFGRERPIFGTCAGAILLANNVTSPAQPDRPLEPSLGLMDMQVERNAYGRQLDSRIAHVHLNHAENLPVPAANPRAANPRAADPQARPETQLTQPATPPASAPDLEAVFIRAPIIRRVGEGAHVLATYHGDPVLVEQGRHLAATFHPELTDDSRVHLMFLGKIP